MAIVAVVTMLSALMSCGNDEGAKGDPSAVDASSGATENTSSGATTTTVDPAADVDAARRAITAFEDEALRRGYRASTDEDDDGELEFLTEECKAFDEWLLDDGDTSGEMADEESAELQKGSLDTGGREESLSAAVFFAVSEQMMGDEFAVARDPRLPACLEEGIRLEMEEVEQAAATNGMDFDFDFRVETTEVSNVGEDAVAIVAEGTMTMGPMTVPLALHTGFARQGRIGVWVVSGISGVDGPPADVVPLLELLIEEAGA